MIDVLATEPQYADHLAPIAAALGLPIRGIEKAYSDGVVTHAPLALVASHRDLQAARTAGYRRFARIEHGIGQSYYGDPAMVGHSAYPGGTDADDVELFLVPNAHAAERWSTAYPQANVDIVGSPRLDTLPGKQPGLPDPQNRPTVAVSFHWDCRLIPETRSALDEYRATIRTLSRDYDVLGHAHPRLFRSGLDQWYRAVGIRVARSFDDVIRQADVYVCDNSSTLYEAAAAGIRVVTINSGRYRRGIGHGLRFWDAIPGLVCDRPGALPGVIAAALRDPAGAKFDRDDALRTVYSELEGATGRAVEALRRWAATG